MMITPQNIKRRVSDAPCSLHDAVCIIYGFDPDKMVIKNSYDYRDVKFRHSVIELDNLYKILRGNWLFWEMRENIFYFVDRTLKNNIQVDKKLLKEIGLYMANLITTDLEYFREQFPYLAEKVKPQQNNDSLQPHRISISKEERNKKFQELANAIFKTNPSEKKKDAANKIYEALKTNNPEYLKEADGQLISLGTIERNIKKR